MIVLCAPLNAVTTAAMLIGGAPVVVGTAIFALPPPTSESLQAVFACAVVVAAVNWVGSQVGRPFWKKAPSLSKSTFDNVVGFGSWNGFPGLVADTSVNSETGARFFAG